MPSVTESSPKRLTLWHKIAKSVMALSVFYGLISITSFKLQWNWWFVILALVLYFAAYWHFLEWLKATFSDLKTYFKTLKEDIAFIKEHLKTGVKKQ